jgi:cytochrome P450
MFWRGVPRPGYRQARAQMDQYLFRIIKLRRDQLQREPDYAGTDMLSVLINAGMRDDLIRDQLMTMLIAGHDTSTASLSWALYLLSANPEAQARARAEIDAVLGDVPPDAENIHRLTYLEQVMNETLRLYPPIHLGSRLAARDLEFNGYTIRKDTRVLYSIYLTQRNLAYWPEPNRFDPERFAPDVKHEPYNFLPFGGGPRNCIGMAFAQVEMRVVLARLLQRFQLERRFGEIHLHMGATLEPRPGVLMQPLKRG